MTRLSPMWHGLPACVPTDFHGLEAHATRNMDSYKLAIKLFFQNSSDVHVEDFVPIFHRWIQARALEGHQLIDVADYKHVHQGPGLLLVSHEANIHIDLEDARPGLLYIRKQPLPGSFRDRLRAVFTSTLQSASMLQADESLEKRIQFQTNELIFRIHDRLHAPNAAETVAQIRSDLEGFFNNLYRVPVQLTYEPHAETLFEVRIHLPKSPRIDELLDRVATA